MLIDAEVNGRRFQEMHVDGGVTAPVLTLPEAFLLRKGAIAGGQRMDIYVLVNDKVERDFQLVPNSKSISPHEHPPLSPRRKSGRCSPRLMTSLAAITSDSI
jgi:hypothetical protein